MSQDATGGIQANNPGASFRALLNASLAAIITNNSGATAPAITYAFMFWADTTSGNLKIRDSLNANWIVIGSLGTAYLGLMSGAALNVLTAVGSQFQVSADLSPLWEGTQSTLSSGAAYALNGNILIMKFRAHNVSINSSGNFTGVSETGIATVEFWGEDDVIRVFTAPSVTAGTVPTFGGTPTYMLDMRYGAVYVHGVQDTDSRYSSNTFNLSQSVASGALTLTLVAPCKIQTQGGNGLNAQAYITTNQAITIPATASLGAASGQQTRIGICWLSPNNTMGVINLSGGVQFDETNGFAPVAISGTSNSNATMYSASGTTVGNIKVLGVVDATWTSGPGWSITGFIWGASGSSMALSGLSSLGFGQTWQSVTRTTGTTYYNTTGKPIAVIQSGATTGTSGAISLTVNGVVIDSTSWTVASGNYPWSLRAIIPPGASYVFSNGLTNTVFELR